MTEHPKVFISYSHDSKEHKQWVLELGEKLVDNGVDVILDQWDLRLGADRTRFMERGVRESERVLVICTDSYVRKANAGEGDVGYEVQIVTSQLVKDLGTDKFIPVIRQVSGEEKTPTCLETRVSIDFTDDNQFEEKFNELLHELHQVPIIEKPPLGKNPFAQLPSGQEARPAEELNTQLPDIPEQVESASHAYSVAFDLARAGDMVGWRTLVKRIQPSIFDALVQWRQNELEDGQLESKEQFQIVDEAVDIISPLISVALMGVESDSEQFGDQKSTLDDLLNIPGWNRGGNRAWIDILYALGYVYHSLHGSCSLTTNQLELALSLARAKIPVVGRTNAPLIWQRTERNHVWERGALMGWSQSLSGRCTDGWEYLVQAYERWEWLSLIFGTELEYRTSLVAYYMALHIHELATEIASGNQNGLNASFNSMSPFAFNVPLTFVSEGQDINERAIILLLRNPTSLIELWTNLNVTREQMEHSWRDWIRLSGRWLAAIYGPSYTRVYHEHFFELLDPQSPVS